MKIVCPHCGEVCETAEDVVIGQHIICPYCKTKFSYGDLPGRPSVLPVEKNEPDDVPTANPPKATKNKVVFDFNRCERELSAKWHRKVKPAKFKWTKGMIAFWSIVVLFNLVFLIFGLPTCLEEWRKPNEDRKTVKNEHQLRADYEQLLMSHSLQEAPGTGMGRNGFWLNLFVPGYEGVTMISLDTTTKEVSIYSPIRWPYKLAKDLVVLRYALEKSEVPSELLMSILESDCQ